MRSISDEDLLETMNTGNLIVKDFCDVYKFHKHQKKYRKLKPHIHRLGGRVFYNLRFGGKNRKVFRSKMFYMWAIREVVPDGLVIDHIDHVNTNDHPSNLRLDTHSRNSSRNWTNKEDAPF